MNISRTLYSFFFISLLILVAKTAAGQSFHRTYAPQNSYCLDLEETTDGGFLMVGGIGTDSSLFLQRTDAAGSITWTNHMHLNGARGIAVCPAGDGGFAVLCENYFDNGALRNVVLKIDSTGTTEWLKILENPGLSNGFTDIVRTADGGFALAGDGRAFSPVVDFYIRLVKLDASGVLLWEQAFGSSNSLKELAGRLAELPNGDLVVAGEQRSDALPVVDGADFFLGRCDAQGNILWQHGIPEPHYQQLYDFLVAPDGSLNLLGETYQANPVRMTLLQTDGNGVPLRYNELLATEGNGAFPNSLLFRSFTCDAAGNMYVPVLSIDQNLSNRLLLFKVNSAGDSTWLHSSDVPDYIYSARYTSDNQFAFAGKSGFSGLNATLLKTDWLTDSISFFSVLTGTVFWDNNNNCIQDSGEAGPPWMIVEAKNQFDEQFFNLVSATGFYAMQVPAGDYSITLHPSPGLEPFWTACDTPNIAITGSNQSVQAPSLGAWSTVDCPYLNIELGAGLIRRCTTVTYTANYCNYGTMAATDAAIQLTADPLLSFVSSSEPLASQNGDVYNFDIGTLAPGQCGTMHVMFSVSCNASNGQAICMEAHIFPDSFCVPPNPQWDGSHLELSAVCNGGAEITITNTGDDMNGESDYVIIEDQIMYMQGTIQLVAGADTVLVIPSPTGSSYYTQVAQRPGHPGNGLLAAVVDMCNGQNGPSLALQLPMNQGEPFLATYCNEVVSSYDPNDKRGFPLGWRSEHYLEAGQDIDYVIRFQNTGNDTAFLVVVRDQLPPQLDPASVRPGAASHPYTFNLSGERELSFTFNNILLPDSTTNEVASHGYVSFRIAQQPDLLNGTVIENNAAIYFDFNEPVVTGSWFHTIGEPLLTFTVAPPAVDGLNLLIEPNPAGELATFRLPGIAAGERLYLQVCNTMGQVVRNEAFSGAEYRFQRHGLAPGMYFFLLTDTRGKQASGALILR